MKLVMDRSDEVFVTCFGIVMLMLTMGCTSRSMNDLGLVSTRVNHFTIPSGNGVTEVEGIKTGMPFVYIEKAWVNVGSGADVNANSNAPSLTIPTFGM